MMRKQKKVSDTWTTWLQYPGKKRAPTKSTERKFFHRKVQKNTAHQRTNVLQKRVLKYLSSIIT